MTWMRITNLLRNRKASVDSDRLYALYGFLSARVVQSPGMEPSYHITTEQAFVNVTYSIMEASKSLMVFPFLNRKPQESTALPSWTPDFRLHLTNNYESNLRVARESLYNASNNAPFYLRPLSSNSICLKGFLIDVIQTWESIPIQPNASRMLDAYYTNSRPTWLVLKQFSMLQRSLPRKVIKSEPG